jgi:hypothetical protein
LLDPIASRSWKTISRFTGSSFCARYFGFFDGLKNGSVACFHSIGRSIRRHAASAAASRRARKALTSSEVPMHTISRIEKLHWRSSGA